MSREGKQKHHQGLDKEIQVRPQMEMEEKGESQQECIAMEAKGESLGETDSIIIRWRRKGKPQHHGVPWWVFPSGH